MTERHTRWLLVVLLVGQMLVLTAQIRNPEGQSSYLEAGAMRVLAPLASFVSWTADGVRNLGGSVRLNRTLIEENERMRTELEQLRQRNMRLYGLEADLERLSEALEYKRAAAEEVQAADIVYIDHSSWLQTAIVAVTGGHVEIHQPVVSADGLVGRVVLTAGGYAKVQLITDRSASTGAMIQRTRRQGVVHGSGRGGLEMDYVTAQADVRVGDVVVTAGIDGVYPRGVPVGMVAAVEVGDELFHRIQVVPMVDFGLLDQVFILERSALPEELKGELPNASP